MEVYSINAIKNCICKKFNNYEDYFLFTLNLLNSAIVIYCPRNSNRTKYLKPNQWNHRYPQQCPWPPHLKIIAVLCNFARRSRTLLMKPYLNMKPALCSLRCFSAVCTSPKPFHSESESETVSENEIATETVTAQVTPAVSVNSAYQTQCPSL